MKRPKKSFYDYMNEEATKHFWNDLAWISWLGWKAADCDLNIRDSQRAKILKRLEKSLDKRITDVNGRGYPRLWDERHWKPLRKIQGVVEQKK